ncbi:histone-lysine N-methyltransferase SETMAR [Trichonephila clavipes]|nr:histone-lysine N-methyltransferase SETMAR [Trichonephila clavipes]
MIVQLRNEKVSNHGSIPINIDCNVLAFLVFEEAAEIVNGVYGADNVEANYVQFWFRRLRSGIFDVEDTPHTEARCLGATPINTKKRDTGWISISEALAKRNEIDPFLKRMVTGDEKWTPYDNIVRKQQWSKRIKQLK